MKNFPVSFRHNHIPLKKITDFKMQQRMEVQKYLHIHSIIAGNQMTYPSKQANGV